MTLCLKNEIRRCRPLLGTFVEITAGHADGGQAHAAINAAFAAVERVHKLMSFHDPESEVSRLNCLAARQNVAVSWETYHVLECAKEFYKRSQGIFDITVAVQLMDRGLLPKHAFFKKQKDYCGRTSDIELLPENYVRFLRPLGIDLGGIAKGFAVDQAVEVLQKSGIKNGVVNAGGDLRIWGDEPISTAIRIYGESFCWFRPFAATTTAVATSSVRTDFFFCENLAAAAHVQMPSGDFLRAVKTVTVFAHQCLLADALTKVALLSEPAVSVKCLSSYNAQALIFGSDGQVERTIE